MDIMKEVKLRARRDFNNSICLMSIIPSLAFAYLLVGKIASFDALQGEAGYIMMMIVAMILLGIITGRKTLWALIKKIVGFSEKILNIETELVEKKRLAAITRRWAL